MRNLEVQAVNFRILLAVLWLLGAGAAQAQQSMELTPNSGINALTGSAPIVVSNGNVSCPTCGTSMANVQSVGVANAGGTNGTVANPTTNPVITLFPTYSGIAKATSGTGYAAAVAGTDYVAPAGSGASLTGITFSQLSGTLLSSQMVALTGDVTNTVGSAATTLATVNSNVGSFTSANITVDAKGRVTAASNGGGGGGISGPGTTVTGYVPQWNSTTGSALSAGLPVGLMGNSTIIETNSSGTIAPASMPVATTGALGAVRPDGTTITVNGSGVVSVVGSCAATSVIVGTTTVGGGTSGYILYNNAGVIGNLPTTGSGNVVLATAPTLPSATLTSAAFGDSGTTLLTASTVTIPNTYQIALFDPTSNAIAATIQSCSSGTKWDQDFKDATGHAGTHAITLTPAAGTIDGSANAAIGTAYGSLHIHSNGAICSIL